MAKKPLVTPQANAAAVAPSGLLATVWYAWAKSVTDALQEAIKARQVIESNTAPTTDDIPEGEFRVWHNTSTAETRLYANVGGSLKSVLLS